MEAESLTSCLENKNHRYYNTNSNIILVESKRTILHFYFPAGSSRIAEHFVDGSPGAGAVSDRVDDVAGGRS